MDNKSIQIIKNNFLKKITFQDGEQLFISLLVHFHIHQQMYLLGYNFLNILWSLETEFLTVNESTV